MYFVPQGADEAAVRGCVEIDGKGEEAAVDEDGGEEEEQREGLQTSRLGSHFDSFDLSQSS